MSDPGGRRPPPRASGRTIALALVGGFAGGLVVWWLAQFLARATVVLLVAGVVVVLLLSWAGREHPGEDAQDIRRRKRVLKGIVMVVGVSVSLFLLAIGALWAAVAAGAVTLFPTK